MKVDYVCMTAGLFAVVRSMGKNYVDVVVVVCRLQW